MSLSQSSALKMGGNKKLKNILRNYELYLFILPGLLHLILFRYVPMYGVQIAFKDFVPTEGITGSEWIGFDHFIKFFQSYQFQRVLSNTIILSVLQLILSFPIPIILALMLNQSVSLGFKKFSQTVLYAPHFISTVVLVGMLNVFFTQSTGLVNNVIELLGGTRMDFLSNPDTFRALYIGSGIWQGMGYNSIIYLAALTSVSPELHEAAIVDGATKFQRIWNVDIPCILPTATILLIMNAGRMMSVGFEKAFLMQNPRNFETSEIISTYVYKVGLQQVKYDYATAIDLFNSIINLILICIVNYVASKTSETSLW